MIQDNICPSLDTGIVEQRPVKENLPLPLLLLGVRVVLQAVKLCPH